VRQIEGGIGGSQVVRGVAVIINNDWGRRSGGRVLGRQRVERRDVQQTVTLPAKTKACERLTACACDDLAMTAVMIWR